MASGAGGASSDSSGSSGGVDADGGVGGADEGGASCVTSCAEAIDPEVVAGKQFCAGAAPESVNVYEQLIDCSCNGSCAGTCGGNLCQGMTKDMPCATCLQTSEMAATPGCYEKLEPCFIN